MKIHLLIAAVLLSGVSAASALTLGYNTGGTRINVARNTAVLSTLSASGGTAPYTWALVGGTLPAGITLNSAGTFSGTSTAAGVRTFTLSATDLFGASSTQGFTMIVNAQSLAGTVQTITRNVTDAWGTNRQIAFSLYLPPGYSTNTSTFYPVIYHLHGIGGTHNVDQIDKVPRSHEAAVSAGLIEPCIIVFPSGYNYSFWADAINLITNPVNTTTGEPAVPAPAETDVMTHIIPHIDATYRVQPGRAKRVVQGFSMGGFGAAKFATKFPASFACCVTYDGAMLDWPTLVTRHSVSPQDAATEVFNDLESNFDTLASPYYWLGQNDVTLRTNNFLPFRSIEGNLVNDNQKWRTALLAQNITPQYVVTGLEHLTGPLFDAQGANSWEFIAQSMAAAAASNTLLFSTTTPSVNESGGSATITVNRAGGTSGAVSVSYATSNNGSAAAGSDYTASSGTLNWADGDGAAKTFTVPITNDLADEADETLTLTLSNATGGAVISTFTATLTITDNDPAFTLATSTGGSTIASGNGTAWNHTLTASGGTGPYVWSIIGGTLPAGVTLSSSGVLTGESFTDGSYTINVQVTDAAGRTDTQVFMLAVVTPVTRNPDGTVTIDWPTTIGGWYQAEFSTDLMNWTLLGNSIKATTAAMTWTDDGTQTGTHPSTQLKRFYRVHDWGVFNVTFTGTSFTYTDSLGNTVTGIFVKPAGTGPFPALIINHGTGGSANGFDITYVTTHMSPWGLACIGANLTHAGTAPVDLTTWGYSSENLTINLACLAALATRSDVNVNKLAMWGHSRGSFASIGIASDLGARLKALGFTAGGVLENDGYYEGPPIVLEPSYPILDEAVGITAPTLMFHGSTDGAVAPSGSLRLQTLLNTLGVTNQRIVYDTTGITPTSNAHNLHQTTFYTAPTTGILDQWHAWLITHGVLP